MLPETCPVHMASLRECIVMLDEDDRYLHWRAAIEGMQGDMSRIMLLNRELGSVFFPPPYSNTGDTRTSAKNTHGRCDPTAWHQLMDDLGPIFRGRAGPATCPASPCDVPSAASCASS